MSMCRVFSCVVGRGCLLFLLWPVLLRWWSRRTCTHLFLRELTRNSPLNKHRQENVGSHQEKILHIQGQRRSPHQTVEGAKLHLESKPIPVRDARRAQTKPCVHQEPRTAQETEGEPQLFYLCLDHRVRWSLWQLLRKMRMEKKGRKSC